MIRVGMFIENRYELLEKIGSGGMSEVYKAKCHKLNRIVAIKFLKQEYCDDKSFVANFQSEAQSAAALLHPNIVSVYDVSIFEGRYFIVMEYVNGITLKQYIEQNGRLPVKEATSIAIQIAQGLEAAHAAGIIHRDIKPQNVLISRSGKIKVTDFGIARRTTANTISTDVVGSVHYISPEQARGGVVDERTDIYSFGIVYYEMITGKMPYDGESTVAIALKHIQETVPQVTDLVPSCPVSTAKIIEKCTQKQPDRRYQKFLSLISDLRTSLVTPNENFVIMEPETADNATIVMSQDEVRMIRGDGNLVSEKASSAAPAAAASVSSREGYRREYSRDINRRSDYEDRYSGRRKGGYEYEDDFEDEYYDDYYDEDRKSGKKFDKVLMVCGIIAGIIIILVLAFICIITFGGGCTINKTSSEIPTETESVPTEEEVPDVIGKKVSSAKKLLEDAGFVVEVEYESSDDVEADYVILQSVDGGEKYEIGGTITITVSTGSDTVVIPDKCEGNSQESVEALLKDAGLKTTVTYKYSDTVETGRVISTNPDAGTEVKVGSSVEIIVSQGPETKAVTVPNLIGTTSDTAQSMLDDLNLVAEFKYETTTNSASDDVVLAQSISAGTTVDEGSTIVVTVGEYQEAENGGDENGGDENGGDENGIDENGGDTDNPDEDI